MMSKKDKNVFRC